jgi:hypothetical protein
MKIPSAGSWVAIRSLSSDAFEPGRDWLHFSPNGRHTSEALHPRHATLSVKVPFVLRTANEQVYFCPTKLLPDGSPQVELPIAISHLDDEHFILTVRYPQRSLSTVFERRRPARDEPKA